MKFVIGTCLQTDWQAFSQHCCQKIRNMKPYDAYAMQEIILSSVNKFDYENVMY
jgi:hypothetical protein